MIFNELKGGNLNQVYITIKYFHYVSSLTLLIKIVGYSRLAWFLNIISESMPNLSINKNTMVSKVIKRDCSKSEPIGWIESRLLLFCSLGDCADILIILEACFAIVDKSWIVNRMIFTPRFLAFSTMETKDKVSPEPDPTISKSLWFTDGVLFSPI